MIELLVDLKILNSFTQVMSTPDGAMSFVPDPKKVHPTTGLACKISYYFVSHTLQPVGGHVMAHACCTRLSLKKGRAENRIIQVVDVSHYPAQT